MLNEQEKRALELIAKGWSDDSVAKRLGITKGALGRRLSGICTKMRANSNNWRLANACEAKLLEGLE